MEKIYGFARCSLAEEKGQDLNRQVRELKAAGATEIITEREHGDAKVKPHLDLLLETAEEGSTLICCEVSRLSRSTQQLCEIVNIIKEKHMRLIILGSITVDCRSGQIDPMSQAFIQMSAVFAELELSILRARVRSGLPMPAKRATSWEGRKPRRMIYRRYSTSIIQHMLQGISMYRNLQEYAGYLVQPYTSIFGCCSDSSRKHYAVEELCVWGKHVKICVGICYILNLVLH